MGKLISFSLEEFGKIDVLINCAGLLEPGDFSLLEINQLQKMIDLNFTSSMIGIQKTLTIMKKQGFGHIINIGSLGGIVPMPYSSVYSATKFALRGFSFSLSEELKGTGLILSLITPGSVLTKMLDYEAQNDKSSISFLSKPISSIKVADAVLKVIQKPKVELIIPRVTIIWIKATGFFPESFFYCLQIIAQTWLVRKKKIFKSLLQF